MKKFLTLVSALALGSAAAADLPVYQLPANGVIGVVGDGEIKPWMIGFAKSGDIVVHVIAPDHESMQKIAKAADEAGVGGKLLVEAIPASPLPYRDNLLNALVIEVEGFDVEGAIEMVAPGGRMLARTEIAGRSLWKISQRVRPEGMDVWTHQYRDAGGNSGVSTDQFVEFPLGLRWNDDLPFNLRTNTEWSQGWTNTRAISIVDGRIYYVTSCARENLKRTADELAKSTETHDMVLVARDAWNGTQLWRKNLGPIFYGGLFYTARAPMVAMDGKVWAVNKDQQLLEMDGETGEVLRTMKTRHMTAHLMLVDGVLVAATWEGGDDVGAKTGIDRRPLDIEVTEGTIEGFSLDSGERLWETAHMATSIRSADGRVYLVHRTGTDEFEIAKALKAKRRGEDPEQAEDPNRGAQIVVALDMKTGEVIWEVSAEDLGAKPVDHLAVSLAGMGGVTVSRNTYAITQSEDSGGREAIWLNGETGEAIVKRPNAGFPVIYDGAVHLGGVAFNPETGEQAEGIQGVNVGATVCTPQVFVNGIKTNNRSLRYDDNGEAKTFGAARGSCMFAGIPANGAFYTAQTYCACAPGTAPGFIAFGPIGTEPDRDSVIAGSELIQGPSYGKQSGEGASGWSTFMGNAERGNANPNAEIPAGELRIAWQAQIAAPMTETNVEGSWKDSLAGLMTAPVVSGGHVFAADLHRRKVVMSGADDGEVVWETHLGGRVTTPPTIFGGLCLIGAADGYVYALDESDGSLAWKLRMAPSERRMVSYAQLESPWAVFSSVLVDDEGTAYASAGRTTGAESGIVVRAFQPITGEVIWSETIAYPEGRRGDHINDVIYVNGDHLHLMKTVLDRKTGQQLPNPAIAHDNAMREWNRLRIEATKAGEPVPPQPEPEIELAMHNHGIEGIASPNWTKLGNRRRRDSSLDGVRGTVLAFDETTVVNSRQGFDRAEGKALWSVAGSNEQVTAIALGKNAVVFGGGFFPEDGGEQGFVRVVNRTTGEVIGRLEFPAPLSFQGIAIEGDRIFATFENGKLVCLAANEQSSD